MIISPRAFRILFLFVLLPAGSLRAQTNQLKSIVARLRSIDTRENGYPSGDVPILARQLLPTLKSSLREVLLRSLNEHNVSDTKILRDLLLEDLKNQGVQFAPTAGDALDPESGNEFGLLYDIRVSQPTRHPDLLAVVTELGIPCGSDSSLNLFRRKDSTWDLLLIDESNDLEDIAGAQGNFQFAVSPPDEAGNWFVVTANVNPWCSSNWQQLRYKVLRTGSKADHPLELLREKTTVYLGADEPYRLKIQPHGFEISNVASNSLDSAILTRVHIQKYRVNNNAVSRIPPLALAPEDFLDEWVDMKWEEAGKWVLGNDSDRLQSWHTRLGEGGERGFFTEFDFVQPCPASGDLSRWQIGLSLEGGGEKILPEDVPDELFFSIGRRQDSYFLESVATERPPGCAGEARPRGAREYLH